MNVVPIFPRPLRDGDTIAIVSPASVIDPTLVEGAVGRLEREGYRVVVSPHALGRSGSFAGSVTDRGYDLQTALTDHSVRAILCSRGGYGCVHLLADLSRLDLDTDQKWVIGFSDVSALHAMMASRGIVSVHSSMAKALAQEREIPNNALLAILRGERPSLSFQSHRYNRPGCATGRLVGGNLAVLQALINTRFDIFAPDTILFIEDIAEPIYKVERILYQLRLAGVLDRVAGLVVGQFTEYRPSADHPDMETMIDRFLGDVAFPVAFGAPVGHVDDNMPLLHNAVATLTVDAENSRIEYA